jgi:hypothetical protein
LGRLIRRHAHIGELFEQRRGLRIPNRLHVSCTHIAFLENFNRLNPAPARLALSGIARKFHLFGLGQQFGEVALIGVAELPEIVPPPRDIRARVKHNHSLVERVPGRVLLDRAHDAADELNEGAKIGEDAADHGDGEVGMIEPLAKHAGLHDRIELVIFQLLKNPLVRLGFARVDVGRTKPPRAEGLRDLDAMVEVQRRSDDLQPLLAGFLAQAAQLGDRLIDDRPKRLFRHHDTAPEFGVGFAKPSLDRLGRSRYSPPVVNTSAHRNHCLSSM